MATDDEPVHEPVEYPEHEPFPATNNEPIPATGNGKRNAKLKPKKTRRGWGSKKKEND